MSRSVRKHTIVKYGGNLRASWKSCKQDINRYNRRKSRLSIKKGDEYPYRDMKLCQWDWDFCKWYYNAAALEKYPEVRRK